MRRQAGPVDRPDDRLRAGRAGAEIERITRNQPRDSCGRIEPERSAFLRAEKRPWPAPRSVQRDRRAAADRLDLVARYKRQRQPRALQLLQRVLLSSADRRLLVDLL